MPDNASYRGTKLDTEGRLQCLGTKCIDLYLLHWKGCYPYAEIARRHDTTPVETDLAWSMRVPHVIAIPKSGNVVHVEENYRSLSICLSEEDLNELDAAFPASVRKISLAEW